MHNLLFLWHPYHLHPTLDNKLNKWVIFFEVFIGIISIHSTYLYSIPKELSEKSIEEKTVCSYESHRISEMPATLFVDAGDHEQKRRHESKCFFLLCHLACIGDHPNITSAKRWKDVGC